MFIITTSKWLSKKSFINVKVLFNYEMMIETLPIQRIKESQAMEDAEIIRAYLDSIYLEKSSTIQQLKKEHPSLEDFLKLERKKINLENELDKFKKTIDEFVNPLFEFQEDEELKKYSIGLIYISKNPAR